jgi:hypothetical protein
MWGREVYSQEKFVDDPIRACEFLEEFEKNSYRVLEDWRDWPQEDIIREASFRLHCLEEDCTRSLILAQQKRLH